MYMYTPQCVYYIHVHCICVCVYIYIYIYQFIYSYVWGYSVYYTCAVIVFMYYESLTLYLSPRPGQVQGMWREESQSREEDYWGETWKERHAVCTVVCTYTCICTCWFLSQVHIDKGMKDGQKIFFRGESDQVTMVLLLLKCAEVYMYMYVHVQLCVLVKVNVVTGTLNKNECATSMGIQGSPQGKK